MKTLTELAKAHKKERFNLVWDALVSSGYNLTQTAKAVGSSKSSVLAYIRNHPAMAEEYRSNKHGPGRPRKQAVPLWPKGESK